MRKDCRACFGECLLLSPHHIEVILCPDCGGTGDENYKSFEREMALAIDPLLDIDVDNAK